MITKVITTGHANTLFGIKWGPHHAVGPSWRFFQSDRHGSQESTSLRALKIGLQSNYEFDNDLSKSNDSF